MTGLGQLHFSHTAAYVALALDVAANLGQLAIESCARGDEESARTGLRDLATGVLVQKTADLAAVSISDEDVAVARQELAEASKVQRGIKAMGSCSSCLDADDELSYLDSLREATRDFFREWRQRDPEGLMSLRLKFAFPELIDDLILELTGRRSDDDDNDDMG